jgi:hypothetical protein
MIGSFQDMADLQSWATRRADDSLESYRSGGTLLSLGYALAMLDIAESKICSPHLVPTRLKAMGGPSTAQPESPRLVA